MIAPEYFGVVATALIVLNILRVLVDGGFGAALVQRKHISRTDISTVFYLNIAIAFVSLGIIALVSNWIAIYFEQPDLTWIVPALGLTLVFASFGQAQSQMLVKQLKFKFLAKITFPPVLAGGAVGITLAFMGANVWALIGQQLTQSCLRSTLLWMLSPRENQPDFKFSVSSFRKLSGFSFAVLGNELLRRITQNLTGMIIAKSFGVEDLAFYNRARFFQRSPTQPLVSLLNRVLFPVFSEIQNEPKKIKSTLRSGIPIAIGCVAPLMFWLMATAKPLVIVTLTDVWSETIQYLRIVPLMGITLVLSGIKSNVIRSQGNGKLIFLLSVCRNSLIVVGLVITWRYGIIAMVIGQIVCFGLNMVINDYFTQRYTGYTLLEQWADWTPYVILSSFAGAIALAVSWANMSNHLVMLVLQTIVFGAVYFAGCWTMNLLLYRKIVSQINRLKNSASRIGLQSAKEIRN